MRIATFNVNSIRSRIDRVETLLKRHEIDVLAIQETKARDDQWPLMGLEAMGYEVATHGYDQWNGVAIASRVGLSDVRRGFEDMPQWGEPLASEAPRTMPAMSTNSTVAGRTLAEPKISASFGRRESGTPTTPTFGSIVANG